ncbi:MAG: hypothetical protein OD814_000496 [Candidatus Alkanophagales archaeon MCA70_species_1]|nr:hypothetical protein [Candidatus Alkanophaga volatiphilum]
MAPIVVLVAISLAFALVGVAIVCLLLRASIPKTGTPKTIDIGLLRKYDVEKEREVDDGDRDRVLEYVSTGLMQVGLSENARLTAKLTETGKRLLE